MLGFVFESGPRAVVPAIIEGRVPVAADEITLGPRTFRDLGVRIGSTVDVVASADEGGRPVPSKPGRMRVVGKHAVPTIFFDPEGSGSGGAMTLDALRTLRPASAAVEAFLVRFADGVNAEERLAALRREIGDLFILPRQESGDVADLRGVSNAPVALAGILAAMAAATLAHTLVSSIRRRSRDLAILKTLGFVRRQVSAAVAWQASILALVALAVGLPLGVAAGRWAWRAFAGTLGVVPEVLVPLWAIALAVPGMLALANLIAALPARAAARTRPAAVLRTE